MVEIFKLPHINFLLIIYFNLIESIFSELYFLVNFKGANKYYVFIFARINFCLTKKYMYHNFFYVVIVIYV
jgi:hypothetical protein